ncbi:hypothetical protein ASF44_15380 [Pseudorhodoferax sp. Leaf274]|nr:hypothetical protein ASF44_15380 [Pseudorhodoferax sp. Leaf274]
MECEAVIQASQRTFIPLRQRVPSVDGQARTPGVTLKRSIAELAASLKEYGGLQNLIVVQGARNLYEVCAVGRPFEALTQRVKTDEWPENDPVPVLVFSPWPVPLHGLEKKKTLQEQCPAGFFAVFLRLDETLKNVCLAEQAGFEPAVGY